MYHLALEPRRRGWRLIIATPAAAIALLLTTASCGATSTEEASESSPPPEPTTTTVYVEPPLVTVPGKISPEENPEVQQLFEGFQEVMRLRFTDPAAAAVLVAQVGTPFFQDAFLAQAEQRRASEIEVVVPAPERYVWSPAASLPFNGGLDLMVCLADSTEHWLDGARLPTEPTQEIYILHMVRTPNGWRVDELKDTANVDGELLDLLWPACAPITSEG